MEFQNVVAIIRSGALEGVEAKLRELGVQGVSVSKVKGYGEYKNFFSSDWMVEHARIEVFTDKTRAHSVAAAITEAAHLGMSGDGIVAILPVETIIRIRSRNVATAEEL